MIALTALLFAPSFYADVLPIFERRCLSCHRPGEAAPMPLMTYGQARPWAKAIREAVLSRKMPPWFADPRYGRFANDPSLTPEERRTIADWAEAGAPPGPERPPKPGGRPDIPWHATLRMPQPVQVPAGAVLDYRYTVIPGVFQNDAWVSAIEIRPGDRRVIHHAVLYVREPDSEWLRGSTPDPGSGRLEADKRDRFQDILAVYTPGSPGATFPEGMAKKIPRGSDLILQTHYTSIQTNTSDQTSVALRFAPAPPKLRVLTLQMGNYRFRIPAGEKNQRVSAAGTLPREVLLLSFFPHMHLRGSAFEYEVQYPDGRWQTLLRVAPFDFYWQLTYRLAAPLLLPAGTRLLWNGLFDNSRSNPRNPDPSADVETGEQSWQEMMIGFFDVAVDPLLSKRDFLAAAP